MIPRPKLHNKVQSQKRVSMRNQKLTKIDEMDGGFIISRNITSVNRNGADSQTADKRIEIQKLSMIPKAQFKLDNRLNNLMTLDHFYNDIPRLMEQLPQSRGSLSK